MSTILVPIDFSEETPEVIECAALVARRNRSQLVLMHVAPASPAPPRAVRPEDADAVDKLERLERYLRDEGYQVSSAIRAGEPARQIVDFGGEIAADFIIMGRHDHAAGTRQVKSDVTTYVEKQAHCAVVAVP